MESKGAGNNSKKLGNEKKDKGGGCCGGKKKQPKYERDQVFKMGGPSANVGAGARGGRAGRPSGFQYDKDNTVQT